MKTKRRLGVAFFEYYTSFFITTNPSFQTSLVKAFLWCNEYVSDGFIAMLNESKRLLFSVVVLGTNNVYRIFVLVGVQTDF